MSPPVPRRCRKNHARRMASNAMNEGDLFNALAVAIREGCVIVVVIVVVLCWCWCWCWCSFALLNDISCDVFVVFLIFYVFS